MDRRTFLSALLAAPCVSFAGRFSFCQEADKGPEWYRAALAKMKELGTPGIVYITPSTLQEQEAIGEGLWKVIEAPSPDAHEVFLASAFICLTPELAERVGIRKAGEKKNRFLLDPDGKCVRANTVKRSDFENPGTFCESFIPFLHGIDLWRLKERFATAHASMAEEAKVAMQELEAEAVDARDRAAQILLKHAATLLPVYAWERRHSAVVEVRAQLAGIIEKHFQSLKDDRRLPYGTSASEVAVDSCPLCGRLRVSDPKVKKLLRFLTK